MNRIPLDLYYMMMAQSVAVRGTCPRRQVGAVLTHVGKVVSTGYNGAPYSFHHCDSVGCTMVNNHCVRVVHAELNALLQARSRATLLYTTDQPCNTCLKAAVNFGVKAIVYWRSYPDEARDAMLGEAKTLTHNTVPVIQLKDISELLSPEHYDALEGNWNVLQAICGR